jgi:tetratricopeptide (TPR) repeat protein
LFAFGLLAKPMLVSLPFILLLLDYWPLERLTLNKQSLGRLIAEKLPLLFMAVASATITIIAQREAIGDLNRINFLSRISNAALSYCVYLKQVILPTKLAIFYPYILHPGLLNVLMCTVFLVVSTALVLWLGRRNKYLMTGWFWFIVTLVPVIGIMQVGDQSHADRYTYIPFVGIFILIVFGLNTIANKMQKSKKSIVKIAIVFIIIALSVKTWEQVGYWKNDFTLFSHAIEVTKNNYIAYNNLGYQFELTERNNEAIELYKKALDINPKFGEAHYNLGNMLLQTGRADEAISHYKKALEINPNKIDALSNLAGAYFQTNQLKEAMLLMQRALEMAKVAGDESQVKKSIENIELLNQAMGLSQKP